MNIGSVVKAASKTEDVFTAHINTTPAIGTVRRTDHWPDAFLGALQGRADNLWFRADNETVHAVIALLSVLGTHSQLPKIRPR
jgi:hypothetical protein